jgi:hypothetical protein
MPLKKIKKVAKVVDAAMRDSARARMSATDPQFRKDVQKDRRATLSKYETVKQALADREKIEKTRGGTKNKN